MVNTTRSHCLLFHKRRMIGIVLWEISKLYPRCIRMISLLLTFVLGFASDLCNNKDTILIPGI